LTAASAMAAPTMARIRAYSAAEAPDSSFRKATNLVIGLPPTCKAADLTALPRARALNRVHRTHCPNETQTLATCKPQQTVNARNASLARMPVALLSQLVNGDSPACRYFVHKYMSGLT